jgi:DNA-binding transcriptional LysR family regulator
MDLNATRMFVAVVQAGSLSGAADRLNVPLTTLSRRIRALETELKVQLLERGTRGVKLTDSGARLYEHAVGSIEVLLVAKQALAQDQARLKGRLRLSLPPIFEPWWDLLSAFQRQYPEVQVHVQSTERRLDLIEDGIDVALRVNKILHETVVARQILSFRNILVASPDLIARNGLPERPADLHRFRCAVWASGSDVVARWNLGGEAVEPRAVLSTNDYQHLFSRALAGEAVAELPPFLVAGPIREGRLIRLLPNYPLPEWPIYLVYLSHRHPSSIVSAYLDFCRDYAPVIARACAVDEPDD